MKLDPGDVRSANIAKLEKRYPQAFNIEAAINRDLGQERIELEAHAGQDDPPLSPLAV